MSAKEKESTPESRFAERFEKSKFKDDNLQEQLSLLIKNLPYYQKTGRGVEFNALLVNLASAYPQDSAVVLALLNDVPQPTGRFAKVMTDVYAPKSKDKGLCDGCEEPVRWGDNKTQPKAAPLEAKGINKIDECKTKEDIIEFFGGKSVPWVELMGSMKSFALGLGIELPSTRKIDVIAEKILDEIN